MTDDAQVWRAKVTFKTPELLTDTQREELVLKFGDRPDTFTTVVDDITTREVEIEFDVRAETKSEAIVSAEASFSRLAYQVLPEVNDVQIDAEKWEEVERMTEIGTDV